jgi:hypothetical protein
MSRKIVLFIVAVVLFYSNAKSQSLQDIQSPKITPPAPEAAGLGKYGQIPVDKSTGIPGISVPLYEIATPRFKLPISLSYHASGNKVDELATWVGTGWSLNAGGVITRSIVNMPDEASFLYTTMPTYSQLANETIAYMETSMQHIIDTQPDNFFYNFSDQTGAFVFGSDTAHTPVLMPYKPLKVTYTKNAQAGVPGSFTILDEAGNSYLFNDWENTVSSVSTYQSGASSWYLSKMISADRTDTISFVYQRDSLGFVQFALNFAQTYNYALNVPGNCQLSSPVLSGIIKTSNSNTHVNPLYIKSIIFKGGKIDFKVKTGRQDVAHFSLDSVIVSNYDFNQKKYNRLKSYKINTGYWYNPLRLPDGTNMGAGTDYRLKLDSVTENDVNGVAVNSYRFQYDPVLLPPVNFYAQDHWGFYNGRNNNATLLDQVLAVSDSSTWSGANQQYTVGNADRSVDTNYTRAGMLEKIIYPTNGYTVFSYESNKYISLPSTKPDSAVSFSTGYYHETNILNYVPTAKNARALFHIHLKSTGGVYNNANTYGRIVRVSDGAILYNVYAQSTSDVDVKVPIVLTPGAQYQLVAVSMGGTSSTPTGSLPTARVGTVFQDSIPPAVTIGGGLRVKTIKNYDSNNAIISTETYRYGANENGIGTLMNTNLVFSNTIKRPYYDYYVITNPNPDFNKYIICKGFNKIYSSSSTYALSTLSGSPVSYSSVTVYKGDTLHNAGKSLYQYANYADSVRAVDTTYQNGIMLMPMTWKNGQLIHEAHYRNNGGSSYSLVRETYNNYSDFVRTPITSSPLPQAIYINYRYESIGFNNANWPSPYTPQTVGSPENYGNPLSKYCVFAYPISSGTRVPSQSVSTDYAADGVTVTMQTTRKYYYANNAHLFPTTSVTYNGKGDSLITNIKYPQDMVNAGLDPTGIYATMTTKNIINPGIQKTELKDTARLIQTVFKYGSANNIINPDSVSLQTMWNPAEVRLKEQYDNMGNLNSAWKPRGTYTSYIWGYNGLFPTAAVTNAPAKDIFFESFEDGNGTTGTYGNGKTGHYSHTGSYSRTLTGLDTGSYILSYWQYSGSTWTLQSSTIHVTSSSYNISLSTQVDDIRFYPVTAQMTSYTYDPLIGITSETDPKGEVAYYEYNTLQQLTNIKDKDGNIIKHIDYHYQSH